MEGADLINKIKSRLLEGLLKNNKVRGFRAADPTANITKGKGREVNGDRPDKKPRVGSWGAYRTDNKGEEVGRSRPDGHQREGDGVNTPHGQQIDVSGEEGEPS